MNVKRGKFGTAVRKGEKPMAFGHEFDSGVERDRYLFLRHEQERGIIAGLRPKPRFVLQEAFRDAWGKWYASIAYTADFCYAVVETGQQVVEDVKARPTRTDAFGVRWRLFVRLHPTIRAVAVESPTEPVPVR